MCHSCFVHVHTCTPQKQHKKRRAPPEARFMALHLIYDPQDFAEKLFCRLEKAMEKFELRLSMMSLISRLIGVHQVRMWWGSVYVAGSCAI